MTSVIVLTSMFPNRPGERQGNFVYDSASALAGLGAEVNVLVTRYWLPRLVDRLRPPWLRDKLDFTAFPELAGVHLVRHAFIPRNYLWRLSDWLHDRRVEPMLESLARGCRADLIHAHTEAEGRVAVRVARKLGIPAIVTLHGIIVMPRYYGLPARKAGILSVLRAADRLVLVGEPLREFFRQVVGTDETFRVVHNGVVLPDFAPKQILGDRRIRFISVSNLQEGKGVDIALAGLARARAQGFEDWDYTVVGDGVEMAPLVRLAADLGLTEKVRFAGARPLDEIYPLLGMADVFILPSYREAFGIAYLEAMAAGLLAVGVRGQGPAAFIEDGKTGLLVESRDAEDVARCVHRIAAQREVMRGVAAAGAELVRRKFSWRAHALRLMEIYREVLREPAV